VEPTADNTIVEIRGRIAQKLGSQRFNLWFKNSTRLELTDGYLEVGVPNPFIGGWIENHFTDQIAEAAREVTGKDLQISFMINPSLAGGIRKSELDNQAKVMHQPPTRRRRLGDGESQRDLRQLRGRLESFVVGPSNQMAYSAAMNVVEATATRYNPLFVHGGCGLGKTHLLQGIANALIERQPQLRWAYLSGEEFTNRFLTALRHTELESFRNRLRHLDVLIIDDVHFLANKKATQEEFLHTFNAIDAAGKQVVMASDSHPKLIGQLSASLVNRFVSGMVVKIDPPEFVTRCRILKHRAAQMRHEVPEPVIEYIAESLETNVRELEGALLKLAAFSHVVGQPISMGMAKHALAEHISRTTPIVRLNDIESVVATFFGLSPADLHTSRKARTVALARAIAMFLARKHTDMSFPEIGRFMGNKNHSTVILACKRIDKTLEDQSTVCWSTPTGKSEMSLASLLQKLEEQLKR
jgi:chromosomal replication initiator protein